MLVFINVVYFFLLYDRIYAEGGVMAKTKQIGEPTIVHVEANGREADLTITALRRGSRRWVSVVGQYKDKKEVQEKK